MVLQAVCDATGRFLDVSVGNYGGCHDATTFSASAFGQRMSNGSLDIPPDSPIDGQSVPYFVLADRAYPLSKHVMRPYANVQTDAEKSHFNRRHAQARLVIERAFGRLASRFRCYAAPFTLNIRETSNVVLATCALQNFIQSSRGIQFLH